MNSIRLYNTRTRQLESFVPQDPNRVTLYCCGPTVYNYAHIGNARPPVLFGLLARILKRQFPKVIYARNFTDVDDKINESARELGVPIRAITDRYSQAYLDDTGAVGADMPDLQPRVTEHMDDIIAMCALLIDRGHAYAANEHVLFDVASYADYGALSRRSVDDMIAGARVEVAPYKRNAADFVLWKPSTPEMPGWDSPWGRGRPGWHIECSAMIKAHLGESIDIHAGGNDLLFPHHENEVAQSTCAHGGKTFANYWLHNGMMTVDGKKMSKSLGNVHLIHDLRQKYQPEVLRLLLLSGHYRQPLDFSDSALAQSRAILDRLYGSLRDLQAVEADDSANIDELYAQLNDDLNTPNAIAELIRLSKESQRAEGTVSKALAKARLHKACDVLGLGLLSPQQWFQGDGDDAKFDALLAERQAARAAKNFARSDEIRNQLAADGIVIEDTPQGARWKRA